MKLDRTDLRNRGVDANDGIIATAGIVQNANAKQNARFTGIPHFQPSFFAIGLPSSTRLGVATQVLRISMPRDTNSKMKITP